MDLLHTASIALYLLCFQSTLLRVNAMEALNFAENPFAQASVDPGSIRNEFAQALLDLDPRRRNDVAKDNMPLEWGNLKDTEPGFNLTTEEIVKFKLWPKGIIPFYIDRDSFDSNFREGLRAYLTETSGITSLDFQELYLPPVDPEYRYVFFINRRGVLACVDYTTKDFTNKGVQKVVLGYDCTYLDLGSMILGVIGVPPQHNSPDRDDKIKVQEENILPDKRHLFEKMKNEEWLFHDVDYDIESAGHYDSHKFTRNGQSTIVHLSNSTDNPLEDRSGLTYIDLWKIRMLYNRIIRKNPKKTSNFAKGLCPKMFRPGKNFESYKPASGESKEQARPKPQKYANDQSSRIGQHSYSSLKKARTKNRSRLHGYMQSNSDVLHDRSDYISGSERK